MTKAVLFDMDGVLLDTERVAFASWEQAADERGVADIRSLYRQCIGMNTDDIKALLRTRCGSGFDADGFYARAGEVFREIEVTRGLDLMPSVRPCLDALVAAGYRLAVASSTRTETVRRQLAAAGIIGYFETITCGDMVAHAKPAPDIYLQSCASLGLAPADCVAVEDSPNGVRAAVEAGIRCVMIPDQIQPDGEIRARAATVLSHLGELPAYLTAV